MREVGQEKKKNLDRDKVRHRCVITIACTGKDTRDMSFDCSLHD